MSTETITVANETSERTSDGKFLRKAGPGRRSKKLKALLDRYKAESIQETAKLLADDIPRLEGELAAIDADIASREDAFLASLAPIAKHRGEVAVTLSRARVARAWVADPLSFVGVAGSPSDKALAEWREASERLAAAEREVSLLPEPSFTKSEALADADRWGVYCAFEEARNELHDAAVAEHNARQAALAAGCSIDPPQAGGPVSGPDPFAASPSVSVSRKDWE